MKLELTTPVSALTRVGKTTAGRLKRLDIQTVNDLIFYYPTRWQDLSLISEIGRLQPTDLATVKGKIQLIESRRSHFRKTNLTEALIADKSGSIKVIWFNQPYLSKYLLPGDEVYLSGKVDFDRYNLQFVNPVYEKSSRDTTHTARIVPIYSLTSSITQKQLRFLIKTALSLMPAINEYLPKQIIKENQLMDLSLALKQIHFPSDNNRLHEAITRLKFDELFLFQLQIISQKAELNALNAEPIAFNEIKTKEFVDNLPFKLTNDQRKVAWQIISDLGKKHPMNRLLEGEVGSGKTVVAAMAIYNTVLSAKQCALIAPTEILAGQHYQSVKNLLKNTGFKIGLFSRSQRLLEDKKATKAEMLKNINSGKIDIVIGTHALIQEDVIFKDLGLVIVDEQHRFGVKQRQALRLKSGNKLTMPHLLSMTATPIPRTLALTLYGDLDLSLIRELPKERKKVITKIVEPNKRTAAYDFIAQQIKTGRQAFVICPLIDPSDKLNVKAVTDEYEKLKRDIFPEYKISLLHGKLRGEDKEKIMSDFSAGKTDILVATSVIEVGVDIPNASVMLIEGAERFGLAQLYQFRGRVGRSVYQSYCFLFAQTQTQKTKDRLQALASAKDGFELAEFDLKFRGPGEIYGTAQSGFPEFKIAQLTDANLISLAQKSAQKIIEQSPDLLLFPELKERVKKIIIQTHLE